MGDMDLVVSQGQTAVVEFGVSAVEMQRNLADMKAKIDMVQQFVKSVMKEGLDYGAIPYTDNRSLFQPGADKLNALYGYARHITAKDEVKDPQTGHYDVTVKIKLVHKGSGVIVGEGEGSCSTRETKYRYRWSYESDLPRGIDKSTLVSKEFESKKSGKKYAKYRIENADLFDVWNTVLKMAIKRAYVGATLAATGLSGIFQMDEEDFENWVDGEENKGKDKLEKVRSTPQAKDEKSSFIPPASSDNKITQSQYGKIIGDAKRKGLDESGIKEIVQYVKKKSINDLTKSEASGVIEFLNNTDKDDLQDLIIQANMPQEEA
jgi:hypothetical protein